MVALRIYPLAALCLTALCYQPPKLRAQDTLSPEIQGRIDSVGACLTTPVVEKDDPHACQTLADRMVEDHVPGVSVAVIHNGAIEWALGFGVAQLGGAPVTVMLPVYVPTGSPVMSVWRLKLLDSPPVMAVSLRAGLLVYTEASATAIATPADGPSFGTAPLGTWMWTPALRNRLGSMRSCSACVQM